MTVVSLKRRNPASSSVSRKRLVCRCNERRLSLQVSGSRRDSRSNGETKGSNGNEKKQQRSWNSARPGPDHFRRHNAIPIHNLTLISGHPRLSLTHVGFLCSSTLSVHIQSLFLASWYLRQLGLLLWLLCSGARNLESMRNLINVVVIGDG
jgi:hypothetical protein